MKRSRFMVLKIFFVLVQNRKEEGSNLLRSEMVIEAETRRAVAKLFDAARSRVEGRYKEEEPRRRCHRKAMRVFFQFRKGFWIFATTNIFVSHLIKKYIYEDSQRHCNHYCLCDARPARTDLLGWM